MFHLLFIESFPRGFFNRFHNRHKVGIESALHLLARLAGAVGRVIGANRADVPADGLDVRLNVVALDAQDSLRDLRE
jgi:hypothetical protein